MRTTLKLDDDVLQAARAVAERDGRTLGEVVSALARQGLRRAEVGPVRNGIPLLPARGGSPVTLDLVNRLRDEMP